MKMEDINNEKNTGDATFPFTARIQYYGVREMGRQGYCGTDPRRREYTGFPEENG